MALLTPQTPGPTGLEPAFVPAAATGDEFPPGNGHIILIVNNTGGAPCEVSLKAVRPCDQGFLHDKVTIVDAGDRIYINSLNPVVYRDPGTNVYRVEYDQVVGVEVAVLQTS